MHILVTNDDGIKAPGLKALAVSLKTLGQVSVIAPDRNWSATGHSRTLDRPLRAKETDIAPGIRAWAVDGSPADCVVLGIKGFLEEKVDLVVSGINSSGNLGQDVYYSGTVSAAMEAAIWGIPAIAVSLVTPEGLVGPANYLQAADAALQVARIAVDNQIRAGIVLNVNVPYLHKEKLNGVQVTRLGMRVYNDRVERREDPRGKPYYWLIGGSPGGVIETGTDVGAIAQGYVSVTPLQLDNTDHRFLPELLTWVAQPVGTYFIMPEQALQAKPW